MIRAKAYAIPDEFRANFHTRASDVVPRAVRERAVEVPGYVAAAKTPDGAPVLTLFGEIGWEVTSRMVAAVLRVIGEDADLRMDVNSIGGSVYEGVAIYNLLARHKGRVTAHVLGQASSAAQFITMAADEVLMGKGSFQFIHNSQGIALGDRRDMLAMHKEMEKIDASMAEIITERANVGAKRVRKMMDSDTLLDAKEAIALGMADGMLKGDSGPAEAGTAARKVEAVSRSAMTMAQAKAIAKQFDGLVAEERC